MTSPGGKIYADELDALIDRRVVRLRQVSTQNLSDNTTTAIQYGTGSEDLDSHGLHNESTNNTRITVDKAGVYGMQGSMFLNSQTTPVVTASWVRVNGTDSIPPSDRHPGATNSGSWNTGIVLVELEAGDYVEHMGIQDSAGTVGTSVSSQFASTFTLWYERGPLA